MTNTGAFYDRRAPPPETDGAAGAAKVDDGGLTEEQVERIGLTLMLLEERMTELGDYSGLSPEDLNIDLGPLGPLLGSD